MAQEHITTAAVGAPCWADLSTSDTARSQQFYGQLFGWTAEAGGEEYGGYVTFSKEGLPVAGCMTNEGQPDPQDGWMIYLATDDARAAAEAAAAAGGAVVMPAMDVMALGSMAIVADTGRADVGLWQPGAHKGFGVLGQPGTPAWFELHTRDYDAVVRFYRDVFGWDTEVVGDTPEFRYTTLGKGDAAVAGIMDASAFLPDGAPAGWQIYFAVEDTDAALADVRRLGGAVLQPAEDTPYGRLAQVADPNGAVFKIISGGGAA